jgi:hypothetical protein
MPIRMLKYLIEKRRIMEELIRDDPKTFVSSLVGTFSCSVRRERPADTPVLEQEALLHAMDKLGFLIKVLVLEQLGFEEGHIHTLCTRNKVFSFLRSV